MAPARTPREVLVRLHEEVVKAVRNPELRKRAAERGVELTSSASPEDFTAYVRAEHEKMAKLMRGHQT
jgi:tripartite-type tricarboxylate transporter receptor subunit TctC